MDIRNENQLRKAYQLAHEIKKSWFWGCEVSYELMRDIKDAIRNYYRSRDYSKRFLSDGSFVQAELVHSYGIDGYVERIRLKPMSGSELKSIIDDLWIEPYYSQFDCTGRPFSNWIQCVIGSYGIVLYHSVSYDV